jgi:hypothetical protein
VALPTIPAGYKWIAGGAVIRFVGNSGVTGAGAGATMFCWDQDAAAGSDRVTDLYDENGVAATEIPVVDNAFICAVPKTVAHAVFSVGQTGARFPGYDWDMLDQVSAHVMGDDTVIAGAINNSGSATRTAGNAVWGSKSQQDTNTTAIAGKIAKGALVVNVRDYGATLDGITDDTTPFNNAIAAAGVGGTIIVAKGTFGQARAKVGPLTLLDYQTIRAETTYTARTSVPDVELYFSGLTGAQVGLTLGAGCTVQGITVRGPGSAVGTCVGISNATTSATFDRVKVMNWNTGISQNGTYYSVFQRCEWQACLTGLALVGCYNVNLFGPRFACQNETGTTYNVAINTGTVRNLNIFGGSIENYGGSSGIAISGSMSQVNCFGTYWETGSSIAFGILSASDSVSLNLSGNIVYLTSTARWVSMSGATNSTVNSSGNKLVCSTASTTTPTVYVLSGTGVKSNLFGDDASEYLKAGASYDNGIAGLAGHSVQRPTDTVTYHGRSFTVPAASTVRTGRAATASRPSAATAATGAMFFDTSLNKPIWSTGSVWVDATGATV